MPNLILITGVPATGKTTLATALHKRLGFPVLSKDVFKESLFDSLGCTTRERSREIGRASMDLIFLQLRQLLSSKVSCIAEANFKPDEDNEKVAELIRATSCNVIQVYCMANPAVAFERFLKRPRHPGHCDNQSADEFRAVINKGLQPLNCGEIVSLDTTELSDEIINEMVENICLKLYKV